ncbi:MAG TPA: YegS/Rv2252/BmrU family lipid kinase [Beijerinckiaceae bacterium]|jgi:YegS/Rv2252/BmrU family lipid kinase|nr:YegS/Rv2252/BmrU family lipid kinase [Beijerinckiaceae bacterium]
MIETERPQAWREAVLIVNTRSRRGRKLYARAKVALATHGVVLSATYPVRDPGRLPEIVQGVVARGAVLVIVGGGDGTISSIVDYFVGSVATLAILPLGTANSFARTLTIPIDVEGAADALVNGTVVAVDLGCIDGDLFANAASIGISAAIGRSRPHQLKRYLGRFGYLIAAARMLATFKPFACRLSHEGQTVLDVDQAVDVLIANGPYHGGMLVADEADVESRDIVIRIIKGSSRWALVSGWLRIWLHLPLGPHRLDVVRTKAVTLTTDPIRYVSIDGEVVTKTPIHVSVARRALRVIVPITFVERSTPHPSEGNNRAGMLASNDGREDPVSA